MLSRVCPHDCGLKAALFVPLLWGCDDATTTKLNRKLSVTQEQSGVDLPRGTFKERMGVVAPRAEIHAEPRTGAPVIGTLVAGNRVPRSNKPIIAEGCPRGFYAIEPRGYLCFDDTTTLDATHPTLNARAMAANPKATLPYPYAITRRDTALYEPDPKHSDGVRERRRIPKGSFFAVVGSWDTLDDYDQRQRLAMLTTGRFVPVRDIEPVQFPPSPMVSLDGTERRLPLAITTGKGPAKSVNLSGRYKTTNGERCWSLTTDGCLREAEAVILRPRQELPTFATGTTHWAELDLTRNALLLYEGKTPFYATLLVRSPTTAAKSATTYLRSKQITAPSTASASEGSGERLDLAWVLELDNGLTLRATTSANAYGQRHSENAVELHPDDAHRLFDWLAPAVPDGWHGITLTAKEREKSAIVVL